jgi:4-coumarate--CoA ligase
MGVVPPMALAIIMSPITKNYSLKCIKIATCGAAPMEKATQKRLKDLLADDAVCNQLWGMTETSCVATLFYGTESDETGSVGRPVPCMDMKFVNLFYRSTPPIPFCLDTSSGKPNMQIGSLMMKAMI